MLTTDVLNSLQCSWPQQQSYENAQANVHRVDSSGKSVEEQQGEYELCNCFCPVFDMVPTGRRKVHPLRPINRYTALTPEQPTF
jgi:hypothetical protein